MDKKKINTTSISVKFQDFQPINNTGFVRGVCKVAYAGENRNYTNIPKEAFEKAETTIFGVPVVGNWLGDNYGGHDIVIETKGNEVSFKDATIPYGFVPQDANPRWESVEDNNGNSKNYYAVDVILWHERYPEEVQFIIDNGANQSMEIMVTDGDWDDNWEFFDINDFYYSALCLLGREKDEDGINGEKNVEPCFENSEVIVGQFSMTEKFKEDLFAIKSAFEGGEELTDKTKYTDDEDVVEEVEDVNIDEDVQDEDFTEDDVAEEKNLDQEENYSEKDSSEGGSDNDEKVKNDFELSHNDIRDKIFDILNPRDDEGYREWNYWIMEVFQTYVMVSDESESDKYYRFDYVIDEDENISLSNKTEVFLTWLTQEQKDALEEDKSDFAKLKDEVEDLRAFKSSELEKQENSKKSEIINDYSLLLDESDIANIINEVENFTYDELKSKLAQIFAESELEKAKTKKSKNKSDDTIVFDNKNTNNATKKNKFAI